MYWLNQWRDIKEPIDYIYERYCCSFDSSTSPKKEAVRGIYAYGVSLGASMLSLYLTKEGERCPLNGAFGFGAPFDLRENV